MIIPPGTVVRPPENGKQPKDAPRTVDAVPTNPLPGDLPAPEVVELAITPLQARLFRQYEDAILRAQRDLNCYALGLLAGHGVEEAQHAKLGGTEENPLIRFLKVPPGIVIGQAVF